MFKKVDDMQSFVYSQCHDGKGDLRCTVVMDGTGSTHGILFMHHDVIDVGASIGVHKHEGTEECYYVVSGSGDMIMDGEHIPMKTGDVSLCEDGHTHSIVNTGDTPLVIIVYAVC